ncbi:MAG: peptidoglycan DD-metalloendopeptidase family protein [Actinomycetota bacterium]
MRRFVVLSVVVVVAVLASSVRPVDAASIVLRAPVDAAVADPFRAPDTAYGAGNRGIEYATSAGDRVVAAAPGVVVFAGPVAGDIWVTIDHGGGLKTSYGPLQVRSVAVGDAVQRADRVGAANGPLHFSVRIHGVYVDPAPLFGELVINVRLVPHDTDDDAALRAAAERAERLALYDLAQEHRGGGGVIGAIGRWAAGLVADVRADSLVAGLVASLDIVQALTRELDPDQLVAALLSGLVAVLDPAPCSAAAAIATAGPVSGRRRIAVVVDGLGSASAAPGLGDDVGFSELGYADDDVVRFSYDGGLVPGGGANWPGDVARSSYESTATGQPVQESVDAFIDTVRQIRAANPDAAIDVYGHSLGGVVARLASSQLEAEVDLSVVMTFASPHSGAPLATINDALANAGPGVVLGAGLEMLDPDTVLAAPSVRDLSEAGYVGDRRDVSFPDGVHAVTVGHRADLVVPGTEADAPGARHVIVGGFNPVGAHGEIGALPEVRDEIRLALAGLPPSCQSPADAIFDLVTGVSIASTERAVAGAVVAADLAAAGGVGGEPR